MINLNTSAPTVYGVFGLDPERGEQLNCLLEAAANAYLKQLAVNSGNSELLEFDSGRLIELFAQYAIDEHEEAYCFYCAGSAICTLENKL